MVHTAWRNDAGLKNIPRKGIGGGRGDMIYDWKMKNDTQRAVEEGNEMVGWTRHFAREPYIVCRHFLLGFCKPPRLHNLLSLSLYKILANKRFKCSPHTTFRMRNWSSPSDE
ncbi:hypothetical protein CDAR_47451 [Caerostris darwini]|uniref:Uncharacterized protein n=1 Tax=Caerostris darwini TaxID=1538125 RepID=A0AAV4M9U5_9ARAC|nr:hypothetical protein CDAR_47451 [Caerostris darwini]